MGAEVQAARNLADVLYPAWRNRESNPFGTDMQQYLRRHDVVFRSPQLEGYEGFPLGNGDLTAMVWAKGSAVHLQLGKADVWTAPTEECGMLQRSLGRLTIDFGCPCFEWVQLDDFEARWSPAEGTVTIRTDCPMLRAEVQICADPAANRLLIRLLRQDKADGPALTRVSLARYGSRGFTNWYHSIRPGAEAGAGHGEAFCRGDSLFLTEPFWGREGDVPFTVGLCAEGAEARPRIRNRKCGELELSSEGALDCSFLVSAATGSLPDAAEDLLLQARGRTDRIWEENRLYWKRYWNASLLTVRDGAEWDYLENLYYIHLSVLASGSRGSYPLTFNGGTFTWNEDVRQWGNPHHWNTHISYNGAPDAANHPELMKPYVEAYWRILPQMRAFAASRGAPDGLLLSEMHDFSGRMLAYLGALTPAPQIALIFWDHYCFTGDTEFLRTRAYPFLKGCARFYQQYAAADPEDGTRNIFPAAVCECEFGENFRNTTPDLAALHALLPACIAAAEALDCDPEDRLAWKDFLEHLPPYAYRTAESGLEELAPALDPEGNPVDFGIQNTTFARNASPVYPIASIGVRDRGSRLYQAILNGVKHYPERSTAITPAAVILARLGTGAEQLQAHLFRSVRQLQHFPQGLFYNIDHWSQYSRYPGKETEIFLRNQRDYIYDRQTIYPGIHAGERAVDLPMEPFVQCGFETPALLAMAMQECCLQSREGFLRIFPVEGLWRNGAFTLRARGGFLVSAVCREGRMVPALLVYSLQGRPCRVDAGFMGEAPEAVDLSSETGSRIRQIDGTVYEFGTDPGHCYLIYGPSVLGKEILPFSLPLEQNQDSKTFYEAVLGRPRTF